MPAHPTTRRAVLRDPELDAELHTLGFTVTPFLDPDEVRLLREAYWEGAPADGSGMVVDYMLRDRAAMHRARALIEPIFDRHEGSVLVDQRLVLATYVVKHPGGVESTMYLHDDRSYVDERTHRTTTLWIPLVDVGVALENGTLEVVPRSHLLPTGMSGSFTPDLIRQYETHLRSLLRPVDVTAGHALVYDTRVLHASDRNRTTAAREALALALAPAEAPLVHVVATGRRHRRVHRIDEAFFLDHHVRDIEAEIPPGYPVVAEYDEEPSLPPEVVREVVGGDLPVVEVVLPEDLKPSPGPAGFDCHPVPVVPAEDLQVRADDLGDVRGLPTAVVEVLAGRVGTAPLRRGYRGGTGSSAAREILRRGRPPRSAPDAAAILLEPGARARIDVSPSRSWSHHLTVAECPEVAAGARTEARAANLRLDRRITLPPGDAVTVWNDGPGPLAVVLSRSPAPVVRALGAPAVRRLLGLAR